MNRHDLAELIYQCLKRQTQEDVGPYHPGRFVDALSKDDYTDVTLDGAFDLESLGADILRKLAIQ